jgi:hypothetical protein
MNELLLGLGAALALQMFFVSTLLASGWGERRWTRGGEPPLRLAKQMRANERERQEPTVMGETADEAA